MLRCTAVLFWLCCCIQTMAQSGNTNNAAAFPNNFVGNWKGSLEWRVTGKPVQNFKMELRVQPTDIPGKYTWTIIYGDSSRDNRPYILKLVDAAANHWAVDELDGIILDCYLHGNCLHGAFTVEGNTIVDNYCVENNTMRVEFFSIKLTDKKQSGKGNADTPYVDSYRISSYQSGVLTKVQ